MKPERGELGKSGLASFGFRYRVDIVRKEFIRATFISVYFSFALDYSKLNGWVAALYWPTSVIQVPVVFTETPVFVCPSDLRRKKRFF